MSHKKIGIITSNLTDSYENAILEAFFQLCQEKEYQGICLYGGGASGYFSGDLHENPVYSRLEEAELDGIIVLGGSLAGYMGEEVMTEFFAYQEKLPFVFIGYDHPDWPSINPDNSAGIYTMVQHLVKDHNYSKIAYIGGPEENTEAAERLEGFRKAVKDLKLDVPEEFIRRGPFSEEAGEEHAEHFILNYEKDDIEAIVCADDSLAIGLCYGYKDRGFEIPEDIVVCGLDDLPETAYHFPPITTLRQPYRQMVQGAVEVLERGIDKSEHMTHYGLELVVRRSCGCFASYLGDKSNCSEKLITYYSKEIIDAINVSHIKAASMIDSFFEAAEEHNYVYALDKLQSCLSRADISDQQKTILQSLIHDTRGRSEAYKAHIFMNQLSLTQGLNLEILNADNIGFIQYGLALHLPYLGINSFIAVRFDDENGRGSILMWHDRDGRFSFTGSEHFNALGFAPPGIPDDYRCILLPLVKGEQLRGYFMIEIGDCELEQYNYLYNVIAGAVNSVVLIQKLIEQKDSLSREVARQTKELQVAYDELKEISLKDSLTGLRNRRFLQEVIVPEATQLATANKFEKENTNKRRENLRGLGLYIVDLDHFKDINDTYGHNAGDLILKQFSVLFSENLRKDDIAIRWGGEEFLLVLRNFESDALYGVAQKIIERVAGFPFKTGVKDQFIHCTCSIGCGVFPMHILESGDHDTKVFDAIDFIDMALYYAKNHGRNQAVGIEFVDKTNSISVLRKELEKGLDYAVDKGIIRLIKKGDRQ